MSPAAQFCVSPDSRQSWRTAELRGAAWRGAHARLLGGFVPPGVAGAPPEAGLICVHLRSFAVPNLAFLDGAAPGLAASQAAKQVEPQMNANGGAGGGTRMVGIRTGGRGRQLRWGAECDFRARTLCNGERAGRTPMVGRGRIGRRGWQLWWGAECDFHATSLCKARHTRACHSGGGALTLGAARLDLSRQRGRGEKKASPPPRHTPPAARRCRPGCGRRRRCPPVLPAASISPPPPRATGMRPGCGCRRASRRQP